MKKLLGILIFVALAAGALGAQTVTVTKPALNETWVKGQTYTITWTKSGQMPNTVRISLRDKTGATEIKLIGDNLANSGSYQWLVLADVADGQYVIRVKVKNAAIQDDSDVFSIAAVAPAATIQIQDPGAASVWREGQAHEVKWWVSGNLPGKYSVNLMDSTGTTVVNTMLASTDCCSIGTNAPVPFVPGSYRVRVKNISTGIFGDSPVFTLSPDSITVTQPSLNAHWARTKTYNITWKKTGTLPNTVKIELTGTYHLVLDLDAPNTGSFSWTVPSWLPIGQYGLLITTNELSLYGNCAAFYITHVQMLAVPVPAKIKR